MWDYGGPAEKNTSQTQKGINATESSTYVVVLGAEIPD